MRIETKRLQDLTKQEWRYFCKMVYINTEKVISRVRVFWIDQQRFQGQGTISIVYNDNDIPISCGYIVNNTLYIEGKDNYYSNTEARKKMPFKNDESFLGKTGSL